MKIFLGEVSNFQKGLMWKRPQDCAQIDRLNRNSVSSSWGAHQAHFYDPGGKLPAPDITLLIPGFAFRQSVKAVVFPCHPVGVELLDFDVEGEPWVFANSLVSTPDYDQINSKFMRSIHGQIFFISKLIVVDPKLKDYEVFTISDSNRAYPIFTQRFVRRLEESGLVRMSFKEIGEIL